MMHSCDQLCFQSSVYRSGGTWVIRNEMLFSSWLALFLRNWFCSEWIHMIYILYTYYLHIIYYIIYYIIYIYILYFVNVCHIDLPRSAYPQVPNFLKDFEAEAKKEAGCPCLEHRWTWSSPKSSYWCFQEDSHHPYSRPKRCKCVEQNVSGGNKTDCLECIPGIVSGAHIKSPSLGLFWAINGVYQVNKPRLTAERNQLAYPSTIPQSNVAGWEIHELNAGFIRWGNHRSKPSSWPIGVISVISLLFCGYYP